VSNLWLAVAKSVVFGVLIALIGCHYGLRVKPNTQSLGEGTTASVVTSITVVIVVDAVFAIVFKDTLAYDRRGGHSQPVVGRFAKRRC
jgi:phospholipid/cholesterol/gamma-HCH transport system permease protein